MVEVWHLEFPQAAHSFIVVTRGEKLLQEEIHLQRGGRREGREREGRVDREGGREGGAGWIGRVERGREGGREGRAKEGMEIVSYCTFFYKVKVSFRDLLRGEAQAEYTRRTRK